MESVGKSYPVAATVTKALLGLTSVGLKLIVFMRQIGSSVHHLRLRPHENGVFDH